MAGRGRSATLPAWMTTQNTVEDQSVDQFYKSIDNGHSVTNNSNNNRQYEDNTRDNGINDKHASDGRDSRNRKIRSNSKEKGSNRRNSRSRERDRDRRRGGRSSSPTNTKVWRPKKNRISNWDMQPLDGFELPPICVNNPMSGVPNSFYSYVNPANLPAVPGKTGAAPYAPKVEQSAAMLQTRHARRIYAGGIPPRATEDEIFQYFSDVVTRCLAPMRVEGGPVSKVYLNTEKCYAFVEFPTIELTTACMDLDGIKFDHYTGTTIIRVRRPNDFRPDLIPSVLGPIPKLNLAVLGESGVTVTNGPGKIFIGGLPYNLTDDQIKELLGAFGPVRAFHQVRDPGSATSKGYAFCEYVDPKAAELAIEGLNGMALGDKTLNVRTAVPTSLTPNNASLTAASNIAMGGPIHVGTNFVGNNIMNPMIANSNLPLAPKSLSTKPSTRVLKLSNMITPNDLINDEEYEEIKEDVQQECQGHGRVIRVIIPRARDGYPPQSEGFIFVEFAEVRMAQSAALELSGRKFDNKTVIVEYYDETKFANGILV